MFEKAIRGADLEPQGPWIFYEAGARIFELPEPELKNTGAGADMWAPQYRKK